MSETSPSDLAVVFRGLTRRLDEAVEPLRGDTAPVSSLISELHGVVMSAADTMQCEPSSTVIAEAIGARHAESWTDAELAALRTDALDAGRILRAIAAAAEDAAG